MKPTSLTPNDRNARLSIWISVTFLGVIVTLPVIQLIGELASQPARWPTALKFFPTTFRAIREGFSTQGSIWHKGMTANSNVCQELRAFESEVTASAWPIRSVRDRMQAILSRDLASGNEQVVIGRYGEMYFRPDVEAITSRGFLQPEVTRPGMTRPSRQANPIPAIRQFAADLKARGIELLLAPVPSKAAVTRWNDEQAPVDQVEPWKPQAPIHNADFSQFLNELQSPNPLRNSTSDEDPVLLLGTLDSSFEDAAVQGGACFLKTDTHWTPAGVKIAANEVAGIVRMRPWFLKIRVNDERTAAEWHQVEGQPIERLGDLATLLGDANQLAWEPDRVTLQRIVDPDGQDWQPDSRAEILVLGDSFLNIYSQGELGWGTSAGFVEHLSHDLAVSLDSIAINAGGALASRQELIRQLQQGTDRLAGKKLVIWEFAERELSFGDWQVLALPGVSPPKQTRTEIEPADTATGIEITGEILQVGRMPKLESMPYREALLSIHLKVQKVTSRSANAKPELTESSEIVVYLWGLKDRRLTPATELRSGQTTQLKLVPWSTVEAKYGRFARIELDDPDAVLLDLPTYWGEWSDTK